MARQKKTLAPRSSATSQGEREGAETERGRSNTTAAAQFLRAVRDAQRLQPCGDVGAHRTLCFSPATEVRAAGGEIV
jgi:hypothetical protein